MPRCAASGLIRLTVCSMTSATDTGSVESDRCPDSMRVMSSTSLIRLSRCRPPLRIWRTLSACSASSSSSSSTWAKPRIALSGVRRSWLMRDRNSLFARLARSASSRASCTSSSLFLRAVMSDDTQHDRIHGAGGIEERKPRGRQHAKAVRPEERLLELRGQLGPNHLPVVRPVDLGDPRRHDLPARHCRSALRAAGRGSFRLTADEQVPTVEVLHDHRHRAVVENRLQQLIRLAPLLLARRQRVVRRRQRGAPIGDARFELRVEAPHIVFRPLPLRPLEASRRARRTAAGRRPIRCFST